MASSAIWVRALSSMPTTQIQVIAMMNTTPSARLAQSFAGEAVELEQQERVLRGDLGQARP